MLFTTNAKPSAVVNLIVPLEGAQEIARLRYEIDQMSERSDKAATLIEAEVMLPCDLKGDWSLRVPHGALMISGNEEDVMKARRRLSFPQEQCDRAFRFDVPVALAMANSALDDDHADFLSKITSTEVMLPVNALGCFLGCSGRKQLELLAEEGVFLQILERVLLNSDSVRCRLSTGTGSEAALERVQTKIRENQSASTLIATINAEPYTLDWVVTLRRHELDLILHKNGVFAIAGLSQLQIIGSEISLAQRAAKAIQKLVYECHNATIWNRGVAFTCSDLDRAAQSSGAVLLASANVGTLQVFGTHIQIRQALSSLCHASRCGYQIKYSLTNDKDVREFVSGKKDGKLIKIMKETGVCMSLHSLEEIHRIEFELVGNEATTLLIALDMLMGEFPAEISFYLDDFHHKRLIGHGGKTIQRVMKKHAVYIKFLAPNEATEQAGPDVQWLPQTVVDKLPNVIIRTPAKNEAALEAAQDEIYEMAEENPADVSRETLDISIERLLLETEWRKQLRGILRDSRPHLDVTLAWKASNFDVTLLSVEIHGSLEYCQRFVAKVTALETFPHQGSAPSKLQSPTSPKFTEFLLDAALLNPEWSPASPAISAGSTHSSSNSWSCSNPEVFRPFASPLLCLPEEFSSPVLSPHSPLLQDIYGKEEEDVDKMRGFEAVVGTRRRGSKDQWEHNFPRHLLRTADLFDRHDDLGEAIMQMDWKAIAAEKYRRRASLVFSQ